MRANICCLLIVLGWWGSRAEAARLDSLLSVLDKTIASHQTYADRHEARIEALESRLADASLPDSTRYRLKQ